MKKDLEFLGLPISGPEEDYLETDMGYSIGACGLLAKVGVKSISWQTLGREKKS